MLADETTFRAADCGLLQEYTEVAGQAKSTGMSDALAVAQQDVKRSLDALDAPDQNRYLPEGEQTGNVWKRRFRGGEPCFNSLQSGKIKNDDCCDQAILSLVDSDVGAGYITDFAERKWALADFLYQLAL